MRRAVLGLTAIALVASAGAVSLWAMRRPRHGHDANDPRAIASAARDEGYARTLGAIPTAAWPFDPGRVDVVPSRVVGTPGEHPARTPDVERGATWAAGGTRGFGRHTALAVHPLADPEWILVHAESGLWLVEARTLVRRARLRTGLVSACGVANDGRAIAFAEGKQTENGRLGSVAVEAQELVVLAFPSLDPIGRYPLPKPAHEIRFGADGRTVSSAAGLFGGATIVALGGGGGAPWTTTVHSDAVAAVPIGADRAAYLTSSAVLVVEARGRSLFRYDLPRERVDLVFFKVGVAEFGGELHHDPASDRVLAIDRRHAVTIEHVGAAAPVRGAPIDLGADDGAALGIEPTAFLDDIAMERRFGIPRGPHAISVGDASTPEARARLPRRRVTLGRAADAFAIEDGALVRFSREGTLRSRDFGPASRDWRLSVAGDDVVAFASASSTTKVWRIAGGTSLDATPLLLGTFESLHDHGPAVFASGDRVFSIANDAQRAGIVRLPRGGALGAPEWIDARAMHFAGALVSGDDRFAFRNDDGALVEIGRTTFRVVARDVDVGTKIGWDAAKRCWSLEVRSATRHVCDP